jgi:hypothetical protein
VCLCVYEKKNYLRSEKSNNPAIQRPMGRELKEDDPAGEKTFSLFKKLREDQRSASYYGLI